jgi:quinoprotein glucose dehydrogenase
MADHCRPLSRQISQKTIAVFVYRLGARSTRGGIVRGLPRLIAGVCLGLAAAAAAAIRAQERSSAAEWRYFGGNKAFTRYSSLDQITRDNVKNLEIVWRRPAAGDQLTQAFPDLRVTNYLRSTPIVVDGVLYAQNVHGLVVAFDGETGKTVWEQELFARTLEEASGSSTRGVDYWQGGALALP